MKSKQSRLQDLQETWFLPGYFQDMSKAQNLPEEKLLRTQFHMFQ